MNPTPFPATGYDAEIRRTVPQYDEFFRIICSAVRSHFPDNPVDWLDVGCGTGRMFEEAAEKIPLRSFAFADSSSEMLETARRRFSETSVPTQFFVCRAEKIGKTGKYDVVSSVLVNHYLNGCARRNAYQSAWQALRPGGTYICFENYDPETEKEYLLRRDEWIGFQRANGRTAEECSAHLARRFRAYFPYKLSALVPLLREVGFEKITVLHTSCLQAGVLAQKPFLSTSSGNCPSADN